MVYGSPYGYGPRFGIGFGSSRNHRGFGRQFSGGGRPTGGHYSSGPYVGGYIRLR
jgi:hypothetical protein